MKINKNSEVLDVLKLIKKVDAPPFLLTRIRQKIEASQTVKFSKPLSWSLGISFTIVLALNFVALVHTNTNIKPQSSIPESMNLLPHNSIYK